MLLILLASCNRENEYSILGQFELVIELSKDVRSFNWTDQIEEYYYLPLETKSSVLREIRNIEVTQSGIYISDRTIVNCYDHKGKLKYSINSVGKGPGEYIAIDDMAYADGNLYIYDNNSRKVNIYNFENGKFRESVKVNGSFYEMEAINGFLIFSVSSGLNSAHQDYEITIYNIKEKKYSRYFKNSKVDFQDGFESQLTGNKMKYYATPLSNTVFKIDSLGNLTPHALLDFYGDKEIHDLKTLGKSINSRTELKQSNKYFGLTQWQENEDYIYFHLKKRDKRLNYLYSKKNNTTYSLNGARADLPIFVIGPPVATYKNYFIRPVDSYIFGKIKPENLNLDDPFTKKIYSQIKQVSSNDNPCLLFYKLKNEEY